MRRFGEGLCGGQHDQLTSGILDAVVHPGSLVRQLGNVAFLFALTTGSVWSG